MRVEKVGNRLILGLSEEEKAKREKQEKANKPLLALREMQQYLIQQGFKPKYKL